MTIANKQRKWTVEEFLAWNEQQEARYELIGGYPVPQDVPARVVLEGASAPTMMTGANRQHSEVSAALLSSFRNLLKGKPCRAYANDAAVRTSTDQIRYPDLIVDCGTKIDTGYIFEHPVLIAEVLSPSTKSFDLTSKVTEYWAIETVKYLLVVDPETRRAQLHSRGLHGAPMLEVFDDPNQSVELPELGISLPLADTFAGLPPIEDGASLLDL